MSLLDYDQFDRSQLLQILKEIPVELKKRDKSIRSDLRKKVQQMVEEAGYSLDEVLTAPKPKTPKSKAPPKFRDPANSESTWTGRGRKPLWVLAALESGKSLDDLLI